MRQRLFSMLGSGRMLTRAGRVATALLAVAMLTLNAQTAKADNVLYATVSGTGMTLNYGEESSMPSGAVKYNGSSSWTNSFSETITSVTINASCSGYAGSTLANLFFDCQKLATITGLSNLGTANVTSMQSMFLNCKVLTSLDLSSFNTAAVTTLHGMFQGCNDLTTLDLSSFNTAAVTTMYGMFQGCNDLATLTFGSNWSTAAVTDMYNMFYNCSSLTSLNLSGWNTAKVTRMSSMFYGCSNLASLDLSSFNTAAVTTMYGMFQGCNNLATLTLGSNWSTAAVTTMSKMFSGCGNLTSLDLSTFNTAAVTSMYEMFKDCTKLTTVWVGKDWTIAAVTSKDNTFSGCTSLEGGNGTACDGSSNITADYAIADLGTAAPGYLSALKLLGSATAGVLTLTAGVPDGVKKTFNASSNWFGDASAKAAITSIVVDASCQNATTITSLEYLFDGFTAATSITGLNNLNTANVTNMIGTFRDCQAVTLLDLSAWDTRNVTTSNNMTLMFKRCYELKTIIVGANWIKPYSSDMFTDSKKIVGGYGATTATNPAAYIGSDNADTSETGYLTGATRTLTATQAGTSGEYWATFFNSAVGYSITGGEAFAGVYNGTTQKVELTSLGTDIPANTPVIIRATSGTVNMTVDNTIAAYGGTNNLHGIDVQTATPANSYCLAIGNSGATADKAGFFAYSGANIPARRAYLTISGGVASAPSFIGFGDETTGLKAIDNGQLTIDNYYNLNGQRIVNPTKGLYIVNGKKVVIK